MFRRIKHFIQRGLRGYSDADAWDAHSYLSEVVPGLVRSMKKGHGCPSQFFDEKNINNECSRWHSVLEEIAQGFEAAKWLDGHNFTTFQDTGKGTSKLVTDEEATEKARRKMNRGLKLFAKHYLNLWD